MNLDEAIVVKKNELEEMQKDIDSLEAQASTLKETVKKYNSLKKQSSTIKKAKIEKENVFNTVASFFSTLDDTYLKEKYPLFESLLAQKVTDKPTAAQSIN